MNLKQRSAVYAGLLIGTAALTWPLSASAQQAAAAPVEKKDETVVLSPFTVTTDKDNGYGATNSISGSRVNTPIKDLPIPIQVITNDFINDIGATDLRSSLAYVSGIALQTQNDLDNTAGTYGSAYGPGGVNNPEGVTSNINGVQMKIRGFVTNNVLRDGFYRGSPSDSINIDRVEVVQGPNALLYGTGNFGGVVNYLTKKPQWDKRSNATFAYGTQDFKRVTIDTTAPISDTLAYRVVGAWEDTDTKVDHQSMSHWYISPSLLWKPTRKTEVLAQYEYNDSKQNGFGFRALRAAQGTGGTPINNDQLEATGFYWPPGANKRTFNLSGPDTYNNQQQDNFELTLTQALLEEGTWMPRVDFNAGFNRSTFNTQTRDVNGGIQQISVGNPGFSFGQTITIASVGNGLGDGVTPSNGNLQYGTFNNEAVRYSWNRNNNDTTRQQERVELTAQKALFAGKWYQLQDQFLAGYSEISNDIAAANWQTVDGIYSYKGPLDLSPIRWGVQGDGSPAPGLYQNNRDNINKGWDRAFYLNNFLKFGKLGGIEDRVIIMAGVRKDTADKWSTNTNINSPNHATQPNVATTTSSVAQQSKVTSKQYGVMLKLTKSLSVYALKADGFEPNFSGLHEAFSGAPAGSNTAQSKEIGVKFDFLDGKVSGTISRYKIKKYAWTASGFSSPAPLGAPRFDPSKPIIYNLGDANGTGFFNPFPGQFVANGQTYSPSAPQQAAWIAAVNAGAVTLTSPINGKQATPSSIYLNASTPQGAAWMDEFFKTAAPGWAGWPYYGNDINDPGINNATLDDAAFQNGPQQAAISAISQSEGWDGSLIITPTKQLQFVLTASVDNKVQLIDKGKWIKYPYPQDRWATWYFPNGGFGLKGQTLAEAYTDPTDTSTRTNTGTFPGDDTPRNRFTAFANYKFEDSLKGWVVGLGGDWASKRAYFSGVTHGSGQVQTDSNGKVIVLYMPSRLELNGFVRREWKSGRYNQSLQLNVDNLLNDTDLYGQIYAQGITARLTYQIGF
jgi:outer membrane receptor protein involved in Fe transport